MDFPLYNFSLSWKLTVAFITFMVFLFLETSILTFGLCEHLLMSSTEKLTSEYTELGTAFSFYSNAVPGPQKLTR